jgi:hypothetical protein
MISNRDIYTAANIMTTRYGEDAATQAAMRADEFGVDDIDGQLHWLKILKAIEQLQRSRLPGELVN